MKKKFLIVNDGGWEWQVPLSIVAKNRAEYYANRDKDTTYKSEFDYAMGDAGECIEWFLSNMDWEDVSGAAILTKRPLVKKVPDMRQASVDVSE